LKLGFLLPFTTTKVADEDKLPLRSYLQIVVLDSANKPIFTQRKYLDTAAIDNWKKLEITLTPPQDGTLSVSLVNENARVAYFDNLAITNAPPAIVQENHYDPWGWNLAGVELKGTPEHKFKFLGRESQPETGWVDLMQRMYDPPTARFISVDPKPDVEGQESLTTYQYGYNNPIRYSDPNGDCPDCPGENGEGMMIGAAVMSVKNSIMTLAYNAGDALGITPTAKGMKWEAVERRVGHRYETVMEQVPRQGFLKDAGGHLLDGLNAVAAVSPASGTTTGLLAKTAPNAVVTSSAVKTAKETLGNPFKGKTLEQVQQGFEKQVQSGKLKAAYTDPISGSKSYVNPKSKYSYNVDTGLSGKTGAKVEPPHVDVNYPNPKPKNVEPKRKFFFE
jgi:RHS repeat-associated protein